MKKLITIAIVATLAIVAEAASVSWSVDEVYKADGSGAVASGYAVYFLTSADYAYASAVSDIGNSDFSFLSNVKEGSEGKVVYTESDGYAENAAVAGYATSLDTTAYLVIFDSGNIADASYVYITSASENQALSINALGGSSPISFGTLDGTASASNWTATAVPEPTTGLLMLLGMAGLALRRRRA